MQMLIHIMFTMNRRCWNALGTNKFMSSENFIMIFFLFHAVTLNICIMFFCCRGKNFVIKYECSLRSGDLECFVLEHVEHDRPEVETLMLSLMFIFPFIGYSYWSIFCWIFLLSLQNLRKEIGLFDLRWYGFCLFKALASLHKQVWLNACYLSQLLTCVCHQLILDIWYFCFQGIVHRDVKPGNFLFSRKLAKGYLIDFNLANVSAYTYLPIWCSPSVFFMLILTFCVFPENPCRTFTRSSFETVSSLSKFRILFWISMVNCSALIVICSVLLPLPVLGSLYWI